MIKIFDGHNDTITKLHKTSRSFFVKNTQGHLDLPRALEGGYLGGFFAIFTEPQAGSPESDPMYGHNKTLIGYFMTMHKPIRPAQAILYTDEMLDYLRDMEAGSGGALKIIREYADIENCMKDNVMMAIAHIEGAEALENNLGNLAHYYDKGLRSIGLVWSRPNDFGSGVPFKYPSTSDTGPGLTPAGMELVAECNRKNMIVDLAHLNYKGFFDAAKISKAPLVVSHANVNRICQVSRNLMDDQIAAVAASGGVIGINFEPSFLRPDGGHGADMPLEVIADHFEYITKRHGTDNVGFGTDFDGADMPQDIKDASDLQKVVEVLRKRGFDDEALEKMANKNWLRVLKATLK